MKHIITDEQFEVVVSLRSARSCEFMDLFVRLVEFSAVEW
jgi:hypothetical protein